MTVLPPWVTKTPRIVLSRKLSTKDPSALMVPVKVVPDECTNVRLLPWWVRVTVVSRGAAPQEPAWKCNR